MPRVCKSFSMRVAVAVIIKARQIRERFIVTKASILNAVARGCIIHQRIEAAKQERFSKHYYRMRGDQ